MAVVNFSDSPTQTAEREEPSPGEDTMGELKGGCGVGFVV